MEHEKSAAPNDGEFSMVNRAVPQRGSRELKVEDALLYLDQVKMEFSDRPKIYNEFLEIMKNFKAQSITTPGVIDQVKNLFRGHRYKIELSPEEEEAYPQHLQQQHAISYVTNIRNRFSDEPEIYKSFLKILHTYQREQKGIKDVLEQVSHLFEDHPDLLMEFTYFLPDAVQEQAKERLSRAVKEAELKRARQAQGGGKRSRQAGEKESKKSQSGQAVKKPRKRVSNYTGDSFAQASVPNTADVPVNIVPATVNGNAASTYHSISSERKFFDQVKDLLTGSSRDGWTEFVKCLDLYSHDAISRRDMFLLVQELFGPANSDLCDEFKALITARSAYDSSQQDMWHSIPLTEIDFSQCRRCTPSYRILPSDFPRAVCSGREGMVEQSVLNDEWVSIPIGSEESYSFKHMRRNQYEEALFRSEDDRFEIDMVIDSNMSCIRILEPIAEEIKHLKALEEKNGNSPRFALQMERSTLGTIHLNAIARLYGDHGEEILELLRRNPAGAVPIILKRLKQKDLEWRKARQQLNQQWKEILVKNYDKSLDHRSFYFRQQDKRSYTTRFLVGDIKGVGPAGTDANGEIADLNIPGVSRTCSAGVRDLCGDMMPQLYLTYKNEDRLALRDVYQLLTYATEVSAYGAVEKEKMAAIWRDLFRIILNMPVHFMFDADNIGYASTAGVSVGAWPVETRVLTKFGVGTVVGYNSKTMMHEVQLSFGKGFLPMDAITGAESLSANALEAIGVAKASNGSGKDVIKDVPQMKTDDEKRIQEPCHLFFGTQMSYVFLRLHHTLATRLADARRLATINEGEFSGRFDLSGVHDEELDPVAMEEALMESCAGAEDGKRRRRNTKKSAYSAYLSQLYAFVDTSLDSSKYEDNCRNILGNQAYTLYTLDKIVQQAVKCLHALSTDDVIAKLIGIFIYHRLTPGGTSPSTYQAHVANTLTHTLEEVYRLQFVTTGLHEDGGEMVLACQHMGVLQSIGTSNVQSVSASNEELAPQLVLEDDDEDDDEDGEDGEDGTDPTANGDEEEEEEDAMEEQDPTEDDEEEEGADSTAFSQMLAAADGILKPSRRG